MVNTRGTASGVRAGRAFVELFADDSRLVRGLRRAEKKLRAFGERIRNFGLKLAGAVAAVVAPLGVMTIRAASDAQEAISRFEAVFKDQAKAAGGFAGELAKSVGRSKLEIQDALATFQGFFVGLGFGGSEARQLSQTLQALALDFASFNNLSDEEAVGRFISALSGSSEVLDRFGINIKQAALEQALWRMGLRKGWTEVTEQEKALARLNIIMGAMGDQGAVGDAIRTAGSFTNQLKRLRGTLADLAVEVGGALLPVVAPLVARAAQVVQAFGQWVRENRQVIATVFKVATAAIGVGVALAVLGTVISGVGLVVSLLASAVTGAGAALGVMASAIGLLVTPIGAVTVALTTLGAAMVWSSGAGGQALDWLRQRFSNLYKDASAAFRGIADAIMAGDIALAVKILWLTLKMEWVRGTNYLKGLWLDFRGFIGKVLVGAFTGALSALQMVWHGLEVAWIETVSFLGTAWQGFVNLFLHGWERMKALASKVWNVIKGLFDDTLDPRKANEQIDQALEQRLREIDQQTGQGVMETDQRRADRRQQASTLHEQTLAVLGQQYDDQIGQQQSERADAQQDAERALIAARQEWEEAIADARRRRIESDNTTDPALASLPKLPDLDIGDMLAREADRIASVGTFNPAALMGMAFGSDAAERTANAAEETARNTKRIEREMRDSSLTFA